jgi:hypothetical protein
MYGGLYSVLLTLHVAAATTGLVITAPTLLVPKRRGFHTVLGKVYGAALITMCLTALALVVYRPSVLWPLGIIAVGVLGLAVPGLLLALRRPRGWYIWHLNLMPSSAISFVTAFAVQVTDVRNLWAWLLPTIIGSPLIAYRSAVAQGRIKPIRPRLRPRRT